MKLFTLVAGVAAASIAFFAGCTLLLPTQDLITPCTVQDDCGAGFICEDNACLPEDEDPGSG
jgi:hypothetical protein